MKTALAHIICLISMVFTAHLVHAVQVTFSVDMNGYSGSNDWLAEGVTLNGTFNGWCGSCTPMNDTDGDGVYTRTLDLDAGAYEYKFTIGNWADQEQFAGGESCTQTTGEFINRIVNVGFEPVEIEIVCWEACLSCVALQPAQVTFSVDMNNYIGGLDYATAGVNLNGTFNSWCGNCTPMSDTDGDGVYTATLTLVADSYDYKFVIGNWTEGESFDAGTPCTATTGEFTNRRIIVPNSSAIQLNTDCWNSCSACSTTAVEYTFLVDMSETYIGSFGVFLNGSFNGWYEEIAMEEVGFNVYKADVALDPNTSFSYSFSKSFAVEDLEGTCATFGHRSLVTGNTSSVLPAVCFEFCDPCEGCGDPLASNYSPFVANNQDECDEMIVSGCTYSAAENYSAEANKDDGSCIFPPDNSTCAEDINNDGEVNGGDLLTFLGAFGADCSPPEPENVRDGNVVTFCGYDWDVKFSDNLQGPGPNFFSEHPDDIFIDEEGYLHMTITERDGIWKATELVNQENMGYGKYSFTIEGDFLNIPENIVVGLFTWDNNTFFSQANSEVDIEFSKWGDPNKTNTLSYAVQPVAFGPYYPERINAPLGVEDYLVGVSTHTFEWTPTLISWKSYVGQSEDPADLFAEWEFDLNNPARVKQEGGNTSDPIIIPAPGETTNARINFWLLPNVSPAPTDGQQQEFVVRKFTYEPINN